jgi:hypothetical protein
MRLSSCKSTFGTLTKFQATIDLPASGGTPAYIDLHPTGGDSLAQLALEVRGEFYWTYADDSTEAATRLSSDATRDKRSAGPLELPVVGNTGVVGIIGTAVGAVTDGISYSFVGATDGSF